MFAGWELHLCSGLNVESPLGLCLNPGSPNDNACEKTEAPLGGEERRGSEPWGRPHGFQPGSASSLLPASGRQKHWD